MHVAPGLDIPDSANAAPRRLLGEMAQAANFGEQLLEVRVGDLVLKRRDEGLGLVGRLATKSA